MGFVSNQVGASGFEPIQHPPDRIEVIVHGTLPCGTELPPRGYTAVPGESSPGLDADEISRTQAVPTDVEVSAKLATGVDLMQLRVTNNLR